MIQYSLNMAWSVFASYGGPLLLGLDVFQESLTNKFYFARHCESTGRRNMWNSTSYPYLPPTQCEIPEDLMDFELRDTRFIFNKKLAYKQGSTRRPKF